MRCYNAARFFSRKNWSSHAICCWSDNFFGRSDCLQREPCRKRGNWHVHNARGNPRYVPGNPAQDGRAAEAALTRFSLDRVQNQPTGITTGRRPGLPPLPAPADNSAMEAEPTKAEPPKLKRRWFQFSLRALLIFVVAACFAFAAMKNATYAWTTGVVTVTVLVLIASIALAFSSPIDRRPFWTGFAVCGCAVTSPLSVRLSSLLLNSY